MFSSTVVFSAPYMGIRHRLNGDSLPAPSGWRIRGHRLDDGAQTEHDIACDCFTQPSNDLLVIAAATVTRRATVRRGWVVSSAASAATAVTTRDAALNHRRIAAATCSTCRLISACAATCSSRPGSPLCSGSNSAYRRSLSRPRTKTRVGDQTVANNWSILN